MALITKEGNQIRKIYSPQMDVSRSSLLSISNEIALFRSISRMVYRYDNKLEDYDIVLINYDALDQAVDIFYEIPDGHISEFFLRKYVRKSLRYDTSRNITSVIYHEQDYILNNLPQGVEYINGELINTTDSVITLAQNVNYDLNPDVVDMEPLPEHINVVITSYLNLRLENIGMVGTIVIPAGTYNMGESGYITIPETTIPQGGTTSIIPYTQHDRYIAPQYGVPLEPNTPFIPHPSDIKGSGMSSRKAIQTMGYDVKNRIISSTYR